MDQAEVRIRFHAASPFHADVRARVDAYFGERNLPETANAAMMCKSAFWLSAAVGLFALSLAELVGFPASLLVSALSGVALACVGFNVGHDAIHGSYSKNPKVNRALAMTFEIMGASSLTWAVIHNVLHHTYTNIIGVDQDIDADPTVRLAPTKRPPRWFQRYQFIYAWFLYGFVALQWIFQKDFRQVLAPHPITGKKFPRSTMAGVVLGKLAHFTLFLALPGMVMERPFWQVLVGYFVMMFCAGLLLAMTFELAHVVEGVTFVSATKDGVMRLPWAEHQLATTANFGRSRLTTFITGGLNHQVEHHLFPRVCHIHYPALAPIVSSCAADHGLVVPHSGSVFEAIASHGRMLKRLGTHELREDTLITRTRAVRGAPGPASAERRAA